jgi:predicted ATP-dependent endonuclease of OLD family
LLDEPGLTLHGKAQADLLRFFKEKLSPHNQIIYSTHSPFMVDPERLTSARIVEDVVVQVRPNKYETEGTKVREDVLSHDPDTVFPLQGALGYEITQSLFIGKHTLLGEGPSDILYLKALSSGLDSKWTMCPTGGIGNVKAFVSLFKGNELNIAVLADYAAGQKRQIENLRRSEILEKDAVVTLSEATGKGEADVEDLFEAATFADLLNEAYSLDAAHKLTVKTLTDADPNTERLVLKAEAYFRPLPDTIPEFDHFHPSEWLIEHPSLLAAARSGVKETLDRAEAMFVRINKLLK